MVECLYGGKFAPSHEKPALFSSPRALRFSTEKSPVPSGTNLGTICETTDEIGANSSSCGSAPSICCEDDLVEHEPGPPSYRKPRAISLPAIYRDGSYIKLKTQIVNMPRAYTNKLRRFSAPSGPSNISSSDMPRPLRRLSAGFYTTAKDTNKDMKGEVNISSGPKIVANKYSYSSQEYKPRQLRRHSDPLLYSSVTKTEDTDTGTKQEAKTQSFPPASSPAENTSANNRCRPRRKSSLVPVPFNVLQTQKKKQNPERKRPISFPPSTQDRDRIRSLQKLNDSIPAVLEGSNCVPGQTQRFIRVVFPRRVMTDEGNIDELAEFEDEGISHSKFYTRTERIVQWMNFFG